jgi:hypothetical protein
MTGGEKVVVTAADAFPSVGLVQHMIECGRSPDTAGQRVWPNWQVADALEIHAARAKETALSDAVEVVRQAERAIAQAEAWFKEYADAHKAKSDAAPLMSEESRSRRDKADRNRMRAEVFTHYRARLTDFLALNGGR